MRWYSILIIGILIGSVVGGVSGLQIGYNLPREPKTEVNVSVDRLKANKGSNIDFTSEMEIKTDTLSKKERRRNKKRR